MAIYHLNAKIISRSTGKSAVAAAAYRSRTILYDERQGMSFDYSAKEDLAYSEIMDPEHSPEWTKDRSKLWNEVERVEKRKDAQLARQIEIALPVELSLDQQKELVLEFVKNEFIGQGMIADLNIHSSSINPHAHIMLSTREITAEGFGQKARSWNDKENLLEWRESWAEHSNRHLQLAGFDISIDHRSFADRGLDLEPTKKVGLGYSENNLNESQVRNLDLLNENLKIAFRNGEKIISDPKIALDEISYHQAVFTEKDIAKFANRYSIDAEQFDKVFRAIVSSPELCNIGADAWGEYRFTTKTNLAAEKTMLVDSIFLDKATKHQVTDNFINQAIVTRSMSNEQEAAFRYIADSGDVTCMIGFAGAGKSYTLGAVREAYEAAGYKCKGMALSGIAAEGLEISSGITSKTIHKAMLDIEHNREQFTRKDIIIIDEAGMVATRQMQKIISEARTAGAKVVLVGDPHQLQPIEAGGAFRAILDRVGYVEISEIRRQKLDWMKEASKDFARNRVSQALDAYNKNGHVKSFDKFDDAKENLIQEWVKDRLEAKDQNKDSTAIILAYRNKDIQDLNSRARTALLQAKALKTEGVEVQTERGKRILTEGDRILFLRNEKSLGVKNGSIGTLEKIDKTGLQVKLDSGDRIAFDPSMYRDFDYGYAATVHKTQGVTVDKTYVLGTKHFTRHTAYVAMSRHREDVQLFYSTDQENFRNFDHLKLTMERNQINDIAIDYAQARGLEISDDIIEKSYENMTVTPTQYPEDKRIDVASQRLDGLGPDAQKYIETLRMRGQNCEITDDTSMPVTYKEMAVAMLDGKMYSRFDAGDTQYLVELKTAESKKVSEVLQKIEAEKPKPELSAGQRRYIETMQKQGKNAVFIKDQEIQGFYAANAQVDGKKYACLDDGKNRYLIEHRKEFDNLSFQKVSFDGKDDLKKASEMQKEKILGKTKDLNL